MNDPRRTTPQQNGEQPLANHAADEPVGDMSEWMRGYLEGHETGATTAAITADTVRQMQATAWQQGHDAGTEDATTAAREDIADIISDLANQYGDIDAAFTSHAKATREQRIDREIADMADLAERHHNRHGTTEWVGLDNGAQLPSADWKPDTTELARKAESALADAPEPALNTWADVRAYVDDRVWNRILGDLQPRTRAEAIRQADELDRGTRPELRRPHGSGDAA